MKIRTIIPGMLLFLACCVTGQEPPSPAARPAETKPGYSAGRPSASQVRTKAASKGRKAGRHLMVMSIEITGLGRDKPGFAVGFLQSALMPYIGSIRIFDASDFYGTAMPAHDWILRINLLPIQVEVESDNIRIGRKFSQSQTAHVSLVSIADGLSTLAFSVTGNASSRNATASLRQQLYGDLMRKIADRLVDGCGCNLKVDFADVGDKPDDILLYLDGRPFENGGYVLNGEYMLRAEFTDSSSIQRKIRVAPGRPARITLTLEKQP